MLQAASLKALKGIRHAFFTREGGVSQGLYATLNGGIGSNDEPEDVRENRARMAAALGVAPDRFLTSYQIHSPDVVDGRAPWTHGARPRADAMVTKMPGLALGISTADCGPVLFADAQAARDRRGACRLARRFHRRASRRHWRRWKNSARARATIAVALGPMIRQPSYEVGPEFVAAFHRRRSRQRPIFRAVNARASPRISILRGYVAERLARAGVAQFEDLGVDTCADPQRFYSYRRTTLRKEADYGRHINAIALSDVNSSALTALATPALDPPLRLR